MNQSIYVEKLEKIKLSEIIKQVQDEKTYLKFCWPWDHRGAAGPAHKLWFRCKEAADSNENWGWYHMRVWITVDGMNGFLRDTKCPFDLVRDVPLMDLWKELREIYTLGKIAGDPLMVGLPNGSTPNSWPEPYPDHPMTLNPGKRFIFDNRYPWQGYHERKIQVGVEVYEGIES